MENRPFREPGYSSHQVAGGQLPPFLNILRDCSLSKSLPENARLTLVVGCAARKLLGTPDEKRLSQDVIFLHGHGLVVSSSITKRVDARNAPTQLLYEAFEKRMKDDDIEIFVSHLTLLQAWSPSSFPKNPCRCI